MAMTTTSHAHSNALSHAQQKAMIDEQSQLDEILNELLSEQMFEPDPNAKVVGSVSPNYGSITRQAGNSRTVLSWDTQNQGPTKRAVVTKEIKSHTPNTRSETVTMSKKEFSGPQFASPSSSRKPYNYGGGPSSMRHETRSETFTESHRDHVGSPISSPTPSRQNSVPYRVDYDNRSMDSFRSLDYSSDSELPGSWLHQQQQKLRAKREGKDNFVHHRSQQEKQLVSELKNAQTSIKKKRAQSDAEEQAIIDQFMQNDHQDVFTQNGTYRSQSPEKVTTYKKPSSPQPIRRTYSTDSHKSEKSYFVSGLERPPFSTAQTKYTFSVSPPKSATMNGISGKPPPSPALVRASAPSSPLVPIRSSSKEAVVRSRSVTREWTSSNRHVSREREKKKTPPQSPAREFGLSAAFMTNRACK